VSRPAARLGPECPFWALTTYFNPAEWSVRLRNYRTFRRHLELPLLTVELGLRGRHELAPDDADVLLRLREGDVMWQKERLLNVGLAALPPHVTHVAWLDCDLVFERPGWWRDALAELERSAVTQLFERVVHWTAEGSAAVAGGGCVAAAPSLFDREFAVACWQRMALGAAPGSQLPGRHHPTSAPTAAKGVAWAARRELLASVGWFDTSIVGGGDGAVLAGFLGDQEAYLRSRPEHRRRQLGPGFERWAARAFAATRGRVGAIPGRVFHLWHGDFRHRRYDERHALLAAHDFDAARDLRIGPEGAWQWATPKPSLHRDVADYFRSRREDAADTAADEPAATALAAASRAAS